MASKRRQREKTTLTSLAASVAILSKQVAQLSGKTIQDGTKSKARRKRKATTASPAQPATPSPGALWQQMLALFNKAVASGADITDDMLRSTLLPLLREESPATQKQAKVSTDPSTSSWAERVKKPSPPRLHPGQWTERVLSAAQFRQETISDPVVVVCATADEMDSAIAWYDARGCSASVTFANLENGPTPVLVTGPNGPMTRKVELQHRGDNPPKPRKLASGMKDDAVPQAIPDRGAMAMCRVIVAADFASTTLMAQATKYPHCLPALVLPTVLHSKVITTKAAIAYPRDVTCLVVIRSSDLDAFLASDVPPGTLVMKHKDDSLPQWIGKSDTETTDAYWARVAATAKTTQGRMIYRPHSSKSLGIVGTSHIVADADLPRWYADGLSPFTDAVGVAKWAEARGFLNVSQCIRRGNKAWFFRAALPTEAGSVNTFTFSNGISVAPASTAHRRPKDEHSTPRNAWGSAALPKAARPQTVVKAEAAPRVDNVVQVEDSQVPSSATGTSQPPPMRRKVEVSTPFAQVFEPVECGGFGDCFFTSVAHALHERNAGKRKNKALSDADLGPKGSAQAELRLLTAGELKQHPTKYLFKDDAAKNAYCTNISKAGFWADSRAALALAQATQSPLHIWAFSDQTQRWHLYVLPPHKITKKQASPIWLCLRAQHYQWLRPRKDSWCEDTVKSWLTAGSKSLADLDHLGPGGGRSVLKLLGLDSSSESAPPLSHSSRLPPQAPRSRLRAGPAASSKRGPPSVTTKATLCKDMDLEGPDEDKHDLRPGAHYICPCGWDPRHHEVTRAQRMPLFQIYTHWRRCQGRLPPKRSPEAVALSKKARTVGRAERLRSVAVEKARAKVTALQEAIPALTSVFCSMDFDNPRMHIDHKGFQSFSYICKLCRAEKTTSWFANSPCSTKMAGSTFRNMVHGPHAHDRYKKGRVAAAAKRRARRPRAATNVRKKQGKKGKS